MKKKWTEIERETASSFMKLKKVCNLYLGDIENRFTVIDNGRDYIYDSYLRGYWSYSSEEYMDFDQALLFLKERAFYKSKNIQRLDNIDSAFNPGKRVYRLPTIYQMASLLSQEREKGGFIIAPYFTDNSSDWFWTTSKGTFSKSSKELYSSDIFRFKGKTNLGICSKKSVCKVRGFSKDLGSKSPI